MVNVRTKLKQYMKIGAGGAVPIVRFVALIGILQLLTACPAPGPDCVMADDWGQNRDITVSVPAVEEFTPSGIEVKAGEPLYMKTTGFVDLCPDSSAFDESSIPAISPRISTWQASGVSVKEGDYFAVFISDHNTEETPNSSSYVDRRGQRLAGGKGLYALILPPGELPSAQHNSNEFWMDPTVSQDPNFFELWENDPENDSGPGSAIGGFSGVAPITGTIWFRYARTAEDGNGRRNFSLSGNWEEQWSPWRGRYAWHETQCPVVCFPATFIPLCSARMFPPNIAACISLQYAVCGDLQQLPNQDNCKWDPSDHWVDEDYNSNINGYEIEVAIGCPGVKGKFLEMLVLQPSDIVGEELPVFYPRGCEPGSPGCRPVTNDDGAPLTVTKYHVRTNNNIFSMSMDAMLNSRVNNKGEYRGEVPRSGELWFRIKDTEEKASDILSTPAGCDSAGSANYSAPSNDPVGCVQVVHPDVNPNDTVCYKDYVQGTNNTRVRDAQACGVSLLDDVRNQLATQTGGTRYTYSYIPGCGYKNPNCTPPVGFTGHKDNLGEYKIKVKTTKVDNGFSSLLNGIVKPIRAIIYGACRSDSRLSEVECNSAFGNNNWKPGITERMYNKLVGTTQGGQNPFVQMVRAALLLFITLYGIQFMLGMVKEAQKDFMWNIVRIAVIQQMLSPASWDIFNHYLFTLFIDGLNELISIVSGQFMMGGATELVDPITGRIISDGHQAVVANVDNPFAFFDHTVSRFFSHETWIKLMGLLGSSPVGWLYMMVIIIAMWTFLTAIFTALILYLMAMIAIALLVAVAPIFIAFLLFPRTRGLFKNWVNSLISFLIQPVLVFTALSIFNVFVYSAIYVMLHFSVCWECVLSIDQDFYLFRLDICLFKFYVPWGNGNGLSGAVQFFVIIIFVILANAIYNLNLWMSKLGAEITTGRSNVNLGEASQDTFNFIKGVGVSVLGFALSPLGQLLSKSDKKKDDKKKDDKKDAGKDTKKGK